MSKSRLNQVLDLFLTKHKRYALSLTSATYGRYGLSLMDPPRIRQPTMIFSLKWSSSNFIRYVFYCFPQKLSWNEILNVKNETFLKILLNILLGVSSFFTLFTLSDVKFNGESESDVSFSAINGVKSRKCTKTDF